jgi:hypothetical protein
VKQDRSIVSGGPMKQLELDFVRPITATKPPPPAFLDAQEARFTEPLAEFGITRQGPVNR